MTPSHLAAATMLAIATLFIFAAPAPAQNDTRGLPDCPNPLTDFTNCQIADLSLPSLESSTLPGSHRAMDNIAPLTSNPVRLCWLGHYADRANPAVINESFQIRIFRDQGSFPDPFIGPVFTRTFEQNGAAGVDRLEMSCLDGQNCPGAADPASGGHWLYSVEVAGGFPLLAGVCYWIEIANIGSAGAGVPWSWSASTTGADLRTLHGIEGVYTLFCDWRLNDRALCMSGGVVPFSFSCAPVWLPPICNLSSANGQPYINYCEFPDLPTVYSRSSSPGSVGGPTWFPALLADNFSFDLDRSVSSLCLYGAWYCPTGGDLCPYPPASVATWDIVYYADAAGVPGVPIASFRVGTTPGVDFYWSGDLVAHIYHPPVNFAAGQCYWISIGREQRGDGMDHQWAWRHTNVDRVGDGHYATYVNGQWHQTRLPGADGAVISNLVFLLNAGPVTGTACDPRDCNGNGTPDFEDIAANPALDCYSPAGPPGAMGGPDGVLDSCQCIADWTRDGTVNSSDISGFLTSWIVAVNAPSSGADLDCSGVTNSSDISAFLTAWLASVLNPASQGCP